jgi:hypothetical protein
LLANSLKPELQLSNIRKFSSYFEENYLGFITKINWHVQFRELIDGCYEHRMKPVNIFFAANAESLNVKACGTLAFKRR